MINPATHRSRPFARRRPGTGDALTSAGPVTMPRRGGGAPQQRPGLPVPVDGEPREDREGPQPVTHAGADPDARRLAEVPRRDRDLQDPRLALDDLGEDLLVKDERVAVAQERDRPQELGRERPVA